MTFAWPMMLVFLLGVPALGWWYVQRQRTAQVRVGELAATGLVAVGAAARLGRRRHIPIVLTLAALTILGVALARPHASFALPKRSGTVILAFDVSNSMLADDVVPSRLDAAKTSASAFIAGAPEQVRIGVIAFGDGALVLQPPTDDHALALDAVTRLTPGGGTAAGPAILAALTAIDGKPVTVDAEQVDDNPDTDDFADVAIGYHRSASIVLLSDGENTNGIDPIAVAQLAAKAGVRITTIGVGQQGGAVIEVDGFQLATEVDEALLTAIAEATGGQFVRAVDAAALDAAYQSIDLEWVREQEAVELTGAFALAAALLFVLAAGATLRWFGRVV